ncbi:hypothetical protein LPJGGPFB_01078 [Ensifer adhaerens]|nr:hypothetical protein [Ensifer adhaerens]
MIRDNLTWETNSTLSYPSGNEGCVVRYQEDWRGVQLIVTRIHSSTKCAAG